MPIYEYQCQECGEPFEVFVRSISKKVDAECPNCGSKQIQKGVSSFASRGTGAPATSAANCGPTF